MRNTPLDIVRVYLWRAWKEFIEMFGLCLEYVFLHMDSIVATMDDEVGMCFLVKVTETSYENARL